MKTLTLDDVKKLKPLSEEEINEIKNFKNTDFSDCPKQTPEELKQFRPWREVREELYKPRKVAVNIRLDADVLNWFKAQGKGYQSRINAALRTFAFGSGQED